MSLIADLYPENGRSTATGNYHFGIYFGYGLSNIVGVYIPLADIWGQGWRICYYMAGIPGLFIGLVIFLTYDHHPNRREGGFKKVLPCFSTSDSIKDKDRPESDAAIEAEEDRRPSHGKQICKAFTQPTMILMLLGAILRHAGTLYAVYAMAKIIAKNICQLLVRTRNQASHPR